MCAQKILPAVSIIIPIYNVEKYLAECVDSILGQTFQNIEIILVDDGSSDLSGKMADDYAAKDSRIKVIHKENGGLSSARNAGMKIARGDYIYFCDSDDYISLNAIGILYKIATENNLDMVLFNADSFLNKDDIGNKVLESIVNICNEKYNRTVCTREKVKKGTELFAELSTNNEYMAPVWLQFVKRAYYLENQLRFYEGIIYEDNLYSLKALLLAQRVMFLPEKFYHRRVRAGSIMTSREEFKNFYSYFVVYCEAVQFLSSHVFEAFVAKEAEKVINVIYKGNASRIWRTLSENEKAGFCEQLPMLQRILFTEIIGNGETENRKLRKELCDIRRSYSFRIGRIVTWFPRKIRGGIHCFRQHGVDYTVKRILEHLGIDMGTGDFQKRK